MSLTSTNATNSGRSNYTNTNNNLVGVGVASFSSSNTPFSAATTTASTSNRHQYCNMIATNSSPTSANQTPSQPSASMHGHAHHQHNHLPHSHMGTNLNSNQAAVNAANGISTTAIAVASSSSSSIQFDPTSSSLSTSSTNLSMLGNTNQAIGLQQTTQTQVLPNHATNNNNNNNANNSNINNHVSLQHQFHHHHSTQHLHHNHQANSQQMTSFSNSSTQSTQVISSTSSSNSNSPVNSSLPISILANSHMQTSATLTNNNHSFSSVNSSPLSASLTQQQAHTQPSTSAISSSSTSSSTLNMSSNAHSSSSDWFTYVYKIDNIEELIRSNESQQSFVQSPIFSFTHHVINANANANNQANGVQNTSVSTPSSTQTTTTTTTTTNDANVTAQKMASSVSSTPNKQPSNWRLIFYPNGAGTDCKNFLSIFLKYLSDEPVKIQMMFSIVNNNNEDVYVKYTVNKFNKSNDWGFKQLIHKNAILFQKEKFLKAINANGSNKGSLSVRVKMRLDDYKQDYIKKLNDNLHYCKLLSENFSQYYYNSNNSINSSSNINVSLSNETALNDPCTTSNDSSNNTQASVVAAPSTSSLPSSTSSLVTHSNQSKNAQTCYSSNLSSFSMNTNSSPFQKLNTSSSQDILNSSSNSHFYDISLFIKKSTPTAYEPCSSNSASSGNSYSSGANNSNESNKLKRSLITDGSDCQTTSKKVKLTHQNDVNNNMTSTQVSNEYSQQINNEQQEEFIEIRAHKFMLAARSPVFKAMFNYRLKENLTNKLVIEDSRPEVIDAMIKYIYTAHLPDDTIRNIAVDLYIAAEKYLIESLKFKCRESLVENLSVDSVLQTYILAELYNDSMLRKQSLKFISENIDKVTKNTDWNELVVTYPQYFTNAFIRLCKKDF